MLFLEKKLDWRVELKRKSQFYKTINYDILEIKNQYLWSSRWIISKLRKMDSRRLDLISWWIRAWMERRKWGKKDDRLSKEIATFIHEWSKIVI